MIKQPIYLKEKMYNHLMSKGNKSTCEKVIFKNIKLLQKTSKKNHTDLIKLAVINSSPVIQLRQIRKKKRKSIKEFPYVLKKQNRISLGVKMIVKNNETTSFYEEILLFSKKRSEALKIKETKQELALTTKKNIFFRWFF